MKSCILPALLLLALSSPCKADEPPPAGRPAGVDYRPPSWPQAPTPGDLIGRLVLLTLVSVGCAASVVWWVRRSDRLPAPEGTAAVQVVDAIALNGHCTLYLLQVNQASFVVGVDGTGMKMIRPLAEPFEQVLAGELPAEGPAVPPEETAPRAA